MQAVVTGTAAIALTAIVIAVAWCTVVLAIVVGFASACQKISQNKLGLSKSFEIKILYLRHVVSLFSHLYSYANSHSFAQYDFHIHT